MAAYIISQICVALAIGAQVPMYFVKNKKILLILATTIAALYGVHYLLLGAYSGAALNALGIFRGFWFYYNERKGKTKDYLSLITCEVGALALGILFYTRWTDSLSIIANLIFNFSVWQPNILLFRYLTCFESVLWIVHNSVLRSFAAITEIAILIIKIISVIKFYIDKRKEKQKANTQLPGDESVESTPPTENPQ